MAAVTFVHIGDFHAAPGPRNADRYAALDQIIDECEGLPTLGAWLWPGDLFDAESKPDDRNALDARLKRMASVAPVVIVEGNHDKRGDLLGFANLSGAYRIVVVEQQPQIVEVRLPLVDGVASVFCLPYPHRSGLVGAGVAHGDLTDTASALFEPIFMQAAADLEAARRRGHRTLMIFHGNVAGAIVSTGQPNIGRELEISRAHLDRLGNIYKGGNHIHNPQEIGGAWFAGSCARQDYGEIEPKRYLLVDVEADSSYRVTSRQLLVPPMYHIEGRLSRNGFQPEQDDCLCRACGGDGDGPQGPPGDGRLPCEACGGSGQRTWAGCDVRVRYTYLASERPVIDEQVIRDRFASALRLKVEGVVIPDREVRAPGVVVATSLGDKLAAMREDGALPPSMAARVDALEQLGADEVLAGVQQWLAEVEGGQQAEVAA